MTETIGLFDIVNRHQIYLEGLKARQVATFGTVTRALDELIRDELSSLKFDQLSSMSKAALTVFVARFKKAMLGIYNPWLTAQLEWFEAYIRADTSLWTELYSANRPDKAETIAEAEDEDNFAAIFAAWKNAPLGANGVLPLAMITGMIGTHMGQMLNGIRQGYSSAWTPSETIAFLRGTPRNNYRDGLLNKFNNQSAATMNTIIQAAAAQANGNVARRVWLEYEWCSILDDKTTRICRRLDGKHWPFGKGPLPPAHVGCRSDIKPWEGVSSPDETFSMWARRQSSAFVNDAFDGNAPATYEGAKPISLEQFRGKGGLILSV
jgi:hypothetical protein